MTREEIMRFTPHRDGMLLLDEAWLIGPESAQSRYTVRGDEFFLQGHFPGNPVVPGVMLCEMLAQTCAVLLQADGTRITPYYTGMKNVLFKRRVRPGETVTFACELTRKVGNFFFAKGQGAVDGKVCVTAEFSFALLENEA
ncbi:MAG TPA: 3-hydroxyacyl-ACP dehydratase FabZ family protein [Clostridia bacterium]|nr:3-hydroxyacyl-ACP dehydratase FabZ family protein [Clostridia bacterium]